MGVADEESWAAQCHTREDCRENERTGGGGVGGVGDGGGGVGETRLSECF